MPSINYPFPNPTTEADRAANRRAADDYDRQEQHDGLPPARYSAGADDLPGLPSTPAQDVAYVADRLLCSDPSDSERATAELLNYVAATWDKQDLPLREHAQAVARALRPR
ncbi:hypothetical protein OG897_39915 [Streptomyces sp. NBC_00237]|uniref:hypothetical protein n=1 Tax=Streptomyces sp. NBC_00237 TaxID=2975687 RepID=UPI0022516A12|nr:hypothetical protein [Streptomyces sp. NBC_00237]MCX5207559.1 hypothetical protein [Streptomyces sp. NBC_00237]